MTEAIRFLWLAWGAYRNCCKTGHPTYVAMTSHGVPTVCLYVATGREAWRVSSWAIEKFE